MWIKSEIDGFNFQIKRFESGSDLGIDGGRISKLGIGKDGIEYASYDRGWDKKPTTEEARAVYEKILKKYN